LLTIAALPPLARIGPLCWVVLTDELRLERLHFDEAWEAAARLKKPSETAPPKQK